MIPGRQLGLTALGGVVVLVALLVATALIGNSPSASLEGNLTGDHTPIPPGTPVAYTLPPGASASRVGQDLHELGVISSARQFETLVKLMGVQDRLRATDYEFTTGMSVTSVIDLLLTTVIVDTVRVTFPEGLRIGEMAEVAELAGFGTAEDFLESAELVPLPAGLFGFIPEGRDRQGFLFPDTYILPVGSTPADLVELMLVTFNLRFDPAIRAAAEAQGLTPYQVVIIASIVEREAVVDEERPIIASVYLNRIREGIKLDADPTVQFAISQDPESLATYGYWKAELTLEDLAYDSPYNTYLYAGFPPGPIANPGLASIEAVAFPAETNYYYFVANGILGDGSHVFAETFEEHLRNVAQYQ